ncbi:hypothetical protein D9O40_21975, partial [Clostridium autoethanogenum]
VPKEFKFRLQKEEGVTKQYKIIKTIKKRNIAQEKRKSVDEDKNREGKVKKIKYKDFIKEKYNNLFKKIKIKKKKKKRKKKNKKNKKKKKKKTKKKKKKKKL